MVIFSMSFHASFAILAVAVLRWILIHKLPKKTFMLLWAIVICRLLIPVSIPSPFSIWNMVDGLDSAPSMAELLRRTANEPAGDYGLPFIAPEAAVKTIEASISDLAPGISSGNSPAGILFLLCLYPAGACICVLCFLLPHLRCRKLYKTALPADNGFIRQWIAAHPLRRSLHVTQSDKVDTPLTYGIWNPVILLPRTTDWQNETQLSYILTHEYAHIKHFDVLWKLALAFTLAVHWFNPLVWLMYILANRDLELCCDETVLCSYKESNKSGYAMTLVDLEEKRSLGLSLYAGFSRNAIEERIVSIMKSKKISFISVLAAFLVASGTIAVFATNRIAAIASDYFSTMIAAGGNHSLELKKDGTVWAWGDNTTGQFGTGTTTSSNVPVQVPGLSGVRAVVATVAHSLALKEDGTVWAWGSNSYGQLGDGTTTDRYSPIKVLGLSGVRAIAAGDGHSLALKEDGTVWAWGLNLNGQLGDGTSKGRHTPVKVSGLTGVKAIAAGGSHSLALKSGGAVWAWGNNLYGQIGDATTTTKYTPVRVKDPANPSIFVTGVTAIAAGSFHSLALRNDGTVWAWGYNIFGQLGDGTTTLSNIPVQVSGLTNVTSIAAEFQHVLALKEDGAVWAWGNNLYGQLGDDTNTHSNIPVQVPSLTGVTAIAAGWSHSLALKEDGTVWGMGTQSLRPAR